MNPAQGSIIIEKIYWSVFGRAYDLFFAVHRRNIHPNASNSSAAYSTNDVLKGLPRGLDLNPSEHMWDILGRRVSRNFCEFHTILALEQALINKWEHKLQDAVTTLFQSMPTNSRTISKTREGILDFNVTFEYH
ncbi:hypothetical protein HHI36_011028 [Cryptolaemus montrouzieri]|uniref:Uncharacterized protein n=1 Tax=Cryptolaemus montrouzieri TaxID=559131 RepID=A0ABD2MLC7_9CUCU